MSELLSDTKQKILDAARVLFAAQGFDGTSVRDIANRAEVNVASVNYHFHSKEKLFFSVIDECYALSEAEVELLAAKYDTVEELLVAIFRYFIANEDLVLNHFKMLTSAHGDLYFSKLVGLDKHTAPPGHQAIIKAIQKEVSSNLTQEDLHWALTTLYSHIGHTSIINSCFLKVRPEVPFSQMKDLEKFLRRLVKAVLIELKSKA
jgi:AcrR family transcriptional regulator